MKKIFSAALLASALSLASASAQDAGTSARQQKDDAQAAEKSARPRPKTGNDCSNRAGARCNKPKPRKPWFFGKA